jgi:hypothetical protein
VNAYEAERARLRALPADDFDDEIYELVIATLDLDALYRVEQELWTALPMRDPSLDGDDLETVDRLCEASKVMIDRLVVRVLSDERRYVNHDPDPPSEAEAADCVLCRELRDAHLSRS